MAISQIQVRENPIVLRGILGYFSCLLAGWALLQLPLCKTAAVSGIDSLFTAASAISSTGLVSVDVGKSFSIFGQLILLLLIQLGGIGYLVLYTFVVLNIERKMLEFREKDLSQIEQYTFKKITKQVIKYTILCEAIGAIALFVFFQNAGEKLPLWNGVFHSISAFCTAGFSLFSSNLENYSPHFGINFTLCTLSFLGAIGFFLWTLILKRLTGSNERCIPQPARNLELDPRESSRGSTIATPLVLEIQRGLRSIEPRGFDAVQSQVSGRLGYIFAARIRQSFTSIIILGGALLFLFTAVIDKEVSWFQKVLISFFQTISAATTVGFNTIDLRTLPQIPLIVLLMLMLYGVCLTGSCLNMKGIPLFATFRSRGLTKDRDQQAFLKRAQLTLYIFGCYLLVLFISSLLLAFSEKLPWLALLFEAASALCTVGLSMGITPELSVFGKWLILLLMLIGRTGILILSFVVASQVFLKRVRYKTIPSVTET